MVDHKGEMLCVIPEKQYFSSLIVSSFNIVPSSFHGLKYDVFKFFLGYIELKSSLAAYSECLLCGKCDPLLKNNVHFYRKEIFPVFLE